MPDWNSLVRERLAALNLTASGESDLAEELRSDAAAHEEAESVAATASAIFAWATRASPTTVISTDATIVKSAAVVEASVAEVRLERFAEIA